MEDGGINLTSTCETEQDILWKKIDESLPCIEESESKTASHRDDKDEPGFDSSTDNSVVTFPSTSPPSKTIKVYLRLKPFPSGIDLTKEQEDAYTVVNSTTLLTKFPGLDVTIRSMEKLKSSERVCRTFTFTTAFGPAISQTEFFGEAIEPQIRNFLAGQSSTVMSYGTSNAGKSYTLYGVPSALGIIPLSISLIFHQIRSTLSTPWYKPIYQSHVIGLSSTDRVRELEIKDALLSCEFPEKMEFINAYQAMQEKIREDEGDSASRQDEQVIYSVWISFAEIYNDAIYDLLSSDWHKKRLPLKMVTDKQGRTFIKDLRVVSVNSDEEAYQILLAGQYRSRIAATTLNSRSSRSHCIFTAKLLKYYPESNPEDVEVSVLSFCDLAGSGRLRMTTNIRDRIKETQNINTSLLVLGRCLKSIWEGQSTRQKSEVIGPFRESKLTRLFQKALSGKEQITLIVNVNPVPNLYAETQNVLNFSAIAKKIIVEPVKEVTKRMFMSRFSRVVSRSVKTVTDWDHAAVEDSTHEIYPEEVRTAHHIPRECYDDLCAEYEKLKEEYLAFKNSIVDKDLEIREEMANTYTGLINNLEASWRSRSKDVEEQQEHLLAWSVSQVENFYKEKLNRLSSRKRRRWDDGDAVVDREADIRELEAENASLTAKILVREETIKQLRSARENAIAEKNKTVFELSLVKGEIIGVKKMLEAAENDIRCGKDGVHFTHELRNQLSSRDERIKSLKEFLNEAKEEYIRITSDVGRMQEELKEANTNFIENAEKIEDLEDQLNQSNIFLGQRAREIEQLTEKLEHQSKQLSQFENKARSAERELKESESIRLNLIGAVEDLKKLHAIASPCTHQDSDYSRRSLTDSDLISHEKNVTKLESERILLEMNSVEPEISPAKQQFPVTSQLQHVGNRVIDFEGLKSKKFGIYEANDIVDIDESVYDGSKKHSKLSNSSAIDDSGIAASIGSENQTMEQNNSAFDTDFEVEDENSQTSAFATDYKKSGGEQTANLLIDNCQFSARSCDENNWLTKLFQELDNVKRKMANIDHSFSSPEDLATTHRNDLKPIETELRSADVSQLKNELQLADLVAHFEKKLDEYEAKIDVLQKELTIRMDKEIFCCERTSDKVSRLEKQFSEMNFPVETEVNKYWNKQVAVIERLEREFAEFKKQDDSESQPTQERINDTPETDLERLSELNRKVRDSKISLAQTHDMDNQHKELLESVRRLSSLESKIENWPVQNLVDTRSIASSYEEPKTDTAQVRNEFRVENLDFHRSEEARSRSELFSKVDTETVEDFREFHAAGTYGDEKKFENHIMSLNNKEVKRRRRFKSRDTSWSDEASSTAIELLTAPTSTPRGSTGHSNAKTMLTASLSESSIFLSQSVTPAKSKSQMRKKRKFQQATVDSVNSQSILHEVHSSLRAREIMLIIFIIIVCLVEFV